MSERGGVLIDIGHPAHVHVFKHVRQLLQDRGVRVHVTARQKELSLRLLRAYGVEYEEVGAHRAELASKALHAGTRVRGIARAMRRLHLNVGLGIHNPYVAMAGLASLAKTAILVDSEPVRYDRLLTYPFSSYLLTPRGFERHLGRKHIRFDGFKELAYLHPNYFQPDPRVRSELGVSADEVYFLVRLVAWSAEHDIGQKGLALEQKRQLVAQLQRLGTVFVSSEGALPDDLRRYSIAIPPERMHDALAFASLLVSESQTMTTEAAILGTPVVQTNTLVGTMSNFKELEERYGLLRAFRDGDEAIAAAVELASDPKAKSRAMLRREALLKDKIDVAGFLANVAERLLEGQVPTDGRKE